MIFVLWCFLAQDANKFLDSGLQKMKKGDLDGAVAEFTRAIEVDPRSVEAFCHRGLARIHKKEFREAIADYDRAIEIDPGFAPAYASRGVARHETEDYEGAIADFGKAMELDPTDPKLPLDRAYSRLANRDADGAIEDFTRSLKINPNFAPAYLGRGCACFDRRRWKEALADFRKACDLEIAFRDHGRLRIWIIRARTGDRAGGDQELTRYLKDRKAPDDGYTRIAQFLLGTLSEEAFLKAGLESTQGEKEARAQRCEAYYYAGIKRLLANDPAAAKDLFKKCMETGVKESTSYTSAAAELDALNKD